MESDEVKERVTAANRKLRVEWYRERVPGWWWEFAGKVKAMLGDPLLIEDVEDLCFEFFGCNVERMREVIGRGPSFGRIVMPVGENVSPLKPPILDKESEKPQLPIRTAGEWGEDIKQEPPPRKVMSAAERARAYRERRKQEARQETGITGVARSLVKGRRRA